jgi:GDP-L-fucose synthase
MESCDFADTHSGIGEVRNTHVNIGTGEDVSIAELGALVRQTVGFTGRLEFDPGKPDGTPRKLTDVSRLHALGWRHRTALEEGVRRLYDWYRSHVRARR